MLTPNSIPPKPPKLYICLMPSYVLNNVQLKQKKNPKNETKKHLCVLHMELVNTKYLAPQ